MAKVRGDARSTEGLDHDAETTMKTVMKVISGTIVWVSTASHMLPLVCRDPLACDTTPGQTVVLPQVAMVAMGPQ
jgi:hypothetical protein